MGYDLVRQNILLQFWHYGKPQHWQTSLSNKNMQKRKTKTLINRLKNKTHGTSMDGRTAKKGTTVY